MADILPQGTFGVCKGKRLGAYEGRRGNGTGGYVSRGEKGGCHFYAVIKMYCVRDGGMLRVLYTRRAVVYSGWLGSYVPMESKYR